MRRGQCRRSRKVGAAGADPVEFRLRHQKDPRARAVIEAAAARAAWGPGAKTWGFAYSFRPEKVKAALA